jgi:hypothetical protein
MKFSFYENYYWNYPANMIVHENSRESARAEVSFDPGGD